MSSDLKGGLSMYRRIESFESGRSQQLFVETRFSYPKAIPIDQMIESEFKVMMAIGSGDVSACWSSFRQIALYAPSHVRHWGEKFCEHNLHCLACVAFSKSIEHEKSTSQNDLMMSHGDGSNVFKVAWASKPMFDDIKNLFVVSYASQLFDEIRIDELKFNWSCEGTHFSLGSRTVHHDLFDQVRHRISYEIEMIPLLKVMLKLKPFTVYKKIQENSDFFIFLLTWKFPQETQAEAWKNLLDVRYYLSIIDKNFEKKKKIKSLSI